MEAIATFLLGGALGAALGYLASRKKPRKALRSMPGRSVEAPSVAPPMPVAKPALEAEPAAELAPQAETAPAAAATVTVAEEPTVEIPAVEIPAVEEPDFKVPLAEVPVIEAPPVDTRAVETPTVEDAVEEAVDGPVATVIEPPASEFVITTDLLEEPLPGSGWGPPAATAVEEETIEEILPIGTEEFEPYEPIEVERQPVDVAEELTAVAEEPTVAPEEPTAVADTVPAEIEFVDTEVFETSVVEPVDLSTEMVGETEAVAAISPVDDLKARIEETRRRIRHELEQPFISAEEIEETADWTTLPAVPVIEEPVVSEPSVAEPLDSLAGTVAFEGGAEVVAEETVDYESMKSRIEVTRSRLKAKAFDAMMMGESALLGRDPEGAEPKRQVMPAIDSEIDETIETNLREQEH